MDSPWSLFGRGHWIPGVLDANVQSVSVLSKLLHRNRNSRISSKSVSCTDCKHQTSKSSTLAFLKALCETRGAPHLKPNFPFTDRVPSSRNYLANCDLVQRINRNILFQKSGSFFFTSRGWFRKRPMSWCQSSTLIYVYFFSCKLTTAWHAAEQLVSHVIRFFSLTGEDGKHLRSFRAGNMSI